MTAVIWRVRKASIMKTTAVFDRWYALPSVVKFHESVTALDCLIVMKFYVGATESDVICAIIVRDSTITETHFIAQFCDG